MKEIKTKGNQKNVRSLDKSAGLASKMKQGVRRSKEQYQRLSDDRQASPERYAEDNIRYASENMASDALHGSKDITKRTYDGGKKLAQQIKQKRRTADSIKQTAKSTGRQTFKTVKRNIKTGESAHKTAKTAEKTYRTAIKTSRQTAKAAQRGAKQAAKAAQKSAAAAKQAARTAAKTAKAAARATAAAIKGTIAAVKSLVAVIAAGGSLAVIVILIIVMIALIVGSCFGIFYSAEGGGTGGLTMQSVLAEINTEYQAKIEEAKKSTSYNLLEMKGGRARWQDVLAVYAVKTSMDPNQGQEVATMTPYKRDILKSVFWDMHNITKSTATKTVKEYTETVNENGEIIVTETSVSKTVLYITVEHLSVNEMKSRYGFNANQQARLDELLDKDKTKLWSAVLGQIGNGDIVDMARLQLGNDGQIYWSWYGFESRVEWCACFVSWCANKCGYIASGVIPKFAKCQNAVTWFTDRGQWRDKNYTPKTGDLIFFDWEDNGFTGTADHVGIVEKVEGNTVYTIEGNSGDKCAERSYKIGYKELLGYGVPNY